MREGAHLSCILHKAFVIPNGARNLQSMVIRQYLQAGAIDEMHLALSPVLMGEGENLFAGINLYQLGSTSIKTAAGENATHVFMKKG